MDRKEIVYPSSNGEQDIHGVILTPDGAAKAVVQIVHGMSEHYRRYTDFAHFLAGRGFIVCAEDHAGHGLSGNGHYGYMGAKDGDKHMVTDIHKLYELVHVEHPDLPYVLLGHSMGSFLARAYTALYGNELAAAIYSGTSDMSAAQLNPEILLARILILLRGPKTPGLFLAGIISKMYNKRIQNPRPSGIDWISSDEKVLDSYEKDETSGFPFTYSGYLDLFHLLKSISGKWAQRVPKKLPMYLFSGTEDPVGDYGAGVTRVYERLRAAGCENVEIKLYEGGRHEMLNEVNRDEVREDVAKWIEKVL